MDGRDLARRDIIRLIREKPDDLILVRDTEAGLGIYNPVRRHWFAVVFLLFWLGFWAVGENFAIGEMLGAGKPLVVRLSMLLWIVPWTLGGAAVVMAVLWQLFGVEKLFITGGALVQEQGFGFWTSRRVHPIESVSNVRVRPAPTKAVLLGLFAEGRVLFDIGTRKRSFGVDMTDAEAYRVASLITARLPARDAPALPGDQTPDLSQT